MNDRALHFNRAAATSRRKNVLPGKPPPGRVFELVKMSRSARRSSFEQSARPLGRANAIEACPDRKAACDPGRSKKRVMLSRILHADWRYGGEQPRHALRRCRSVTVSLPPGSSARSGGIVGRPIQRRQLRSILALRERLRVRETRDAG